MPSNRTAAILTTLAILVTANPSQARVLHGGTEPAPIPAPVALVKARAQCPLDKPLRCRAALVHALNAVAWQRAARMHEQSIGVRDITRDAINWAAKRYGVSAADMTTVANCESHLWPFATNGQYKGAWQLGAMHRSDPIFSLVPWQDAYAQASHVARFVKAHSWSAWQCTPSGGLRW